MHQRWHCPAISLSSNWSEFWAIWASSLCLEPWISAHFSLLKLLVLSKSLFAFAPPALPSSDRASPADLLPCSPPKLVTALRVSTGVPSSVLLSLLLSRFRDRLKLLLHHSSRGKMGSQSVKDWPWKTSPTCLLAVDRITPRASRENLRLRSAS